MYSLSSRKENHGNDTKKYPIPYPQTCINSEACDIFLAKGFLLPSRKAIVFSLFQCTSHTLNPSLYFNNFHKIFVLVLTKSLALCLKFFVPESSKQIIIANTMCFTRSVQELEGLLLYYKFGSFFLLLCFGS